MTRLLIALTMAFGLAFPAWADEEDAAEAGVHEAGAKFDYGFSGMLERDNRTQLAPLTLASGKPVASAEYKLKSGPFELVAGVLGAAGRHLACAGLLPLG